MLKIFPLPLLTSLVFLVCLGSHVFAHETGGGGSNASGGMVALNNVDVDGRITEDEYVGSMDFADGEYHLYWTVAGEMAWFGISAETTGWVAVGFEPEVRMQNADMVIGWVGDDRIAHVVDEWSTGPTGPHSADVDLGGTDDIVSSAGSEEDGTTVIEFSRPHQTGDQYDNPVEVDINLPIIWAFGDDDGGELHHMQRGSGTIVLHELDVPEGGPPPNIHLVPKGLWATHASIMSLSFLLMFTAVVISTFYRKSKWWLRHHRSLGLWAGITLLAGFILAIGMVIPTGMHHFSSPHTRTGLIAVIFAVLMPTLGYMMSSKPFRKYRMIIAPIHRWLGRLILLAMLYVIYLGLSMVGIIPRS
jgi:hypothetical protein